MRLVKFLHFLITFQKPVNPCPVLLLQFPTPQERQEATGGNSSPWSDLETFNQEQRLME